MVLRKTRSRVKLSKSLARWDGEGHGDGGQDLRGGGRTCGLRAAVPPGETEWVEGGTEGLVHSSS